MIAVIEYRTKSISPTPPDHHQAWDIEATVTHAAGVVLSITRGLLADIRTALEEAGLDPDGAAIQEKYQRGRWRPLWREVWRGEEESPPCVTDPSPSNKPPMASPSPPPMPKVEGALLSLARRSLAKHPELTTRAMNAAELVRHRHVMPLKLGPSRFDVKSQDGNRVYHVSLEKRTCTCYDWHHNAPTVCGGPMCKHRLACLMLIKMREAQVPAGTQASSPTPPYPAHSTTPERKAQPPDAGRINQQRRQFEATLAAQRAGALLM